MDTPGKPSLIPSLYGYLVCIISIIVTFIAVSMLVNAFFSYSNPLQTNSIGSYYSSSTMTSFDAYKRSTNVMREDDTEVALTDAELKEKYEVAKVEHIDSVRFQSSKDMTIATVLLLIAGGLFFSHWNWLKRGTTV